MADKRDVQHSIESKGDFIGDKNGLIGHLIRERHGPLFWSAEARDSGREKGPYPQRIHRGLW